MASVDHHTASRDIYDALECENDTFHCSVIPNAASVVTNRRKLINNKPKANPYVVLLNIDQQLSFTNDTTTVEFKELHKHMEDLIFFTIGADGLPPLVFIEPIISLKRNGHKRSFKEIDFITLYSFGESEYNILLNMLYFSNYTPIDVQEFILSANLVGMSLDEVQGDIVLLKFGFEN